jgi:hypothetical protein
VPPIGAPFGRKRISMYFPKRLELSFLRVFAFPKATMRNNKHSVNSEM